MKNSYWIIILCVVWIGCGSSKSVDSSSKGTYEILTVAFYNLENFYDPINDPAKFDERSPIMEIPMEKREEVYRQKLEHISFVLSKIGTKDAMNAPVIIGVCEAENQKVLEDLVNQPHLIDKNYGVVHFNGPDERSIDVALLYQKALFRPVKTSAHSVILYEKDDPGNRDYTRDVLLVTGLLGGEKMHFIVNHWPSRSGGEAASEHKRLAAAKVTKKLIDSLQYIDPYAKIITMGDFNDNPYNKSIKKIVGARGKKEEVALKGLYNPFLKLREKGFGTNAYRDGWDIFDQIILSEPFLKNDYSSYRLYKAFIYNPDFLLTPRGEYKGYPFRSYSNEKFSGGYSDHFPVYVYLIKKAAE